MNSREDAEAFAREWIANWNALDVEAVMSHFVEGARFMSPTAARVVGSGELHGATALRSYWEAAIKRVTSLHFTLDFVVWDAGRRTLIVFYDADINGKKTRACELMKFDADGRQVSGEALYGAAIAG